MIPDDVRKSMRNLMECDGRDTIEKWGSDIGNVNRWLELLADQMQSQPTAPEPDWSTAPEGAMWWAVDPDGYCNWFENEPILTQVTSAPDEIGPHWSYFGSCWHRYEAVNIPLGIDGRTTLRKRPEEE